MSLPLLSFSQRTWVGPSGHTQGYVYPFHSPLSSAGHMCLSWPRFVKPPGKAGVDGYPRPAIEIFHQFCPFWAYTEQAMPLQGCWIPPFVVWLPVSEMKLVLTLPQKNLNCWLELFMTQIRKASCCGSGMAEVT